MLEFMYLKKLSWSLSSMKQHILLHYFIQRWNNFTNVFHKSPIETSQPKKTPNVTNILWVDQSLIGFTFLIHFYHKSYKNYMMHSMYTFFFISMECFFPKGFKHISNMIHMLLHNQTIYQNVIKTTTTLFMKGLSTWCIGTLVKPKGMTKPTIHIIQTLFWNYIHLPHSL